MKERDLLNWALDLARRTGWKAYHVPAPMRAVPGGFVGAREAAGLPDLILLHDDPPRMILAELKGDGGKLSDEQREFLKIARFVADEACYDAERVIGVYVWTPFDRDAIETMLKSKVLLS